MRNISTAVVMLWLLAFCYSCRSADHFMSNELNPEATLQNNNPPNVFELLQIGSSNYERTRLRQVQLKFDHTTTGYYLPADKSLKLTLENTLPASDGAMPSVVIGTRVKDGSNVVEIPLKAGENIIAPTQHKGGIIYLRYVSEKGNTTGKVKITLDPASGYINHPYYELGTTNITDFKNQVAQSTIQDVMFKSKDIIVVVNKDKVEKYLMPDAYKGYPVSIPNWLTAFDGILDAEIQISGLSANDPNPLHQPMSNGVKYLMTQVGTGYMYATDWGTGFNGNDEAAMDRLLMENNLINNGWGISHEIGHQNQQGAYKPTEYTETTVNFYTFASVRHFQGSNWQKWTENIWVDKFHNDWFKRSNRDYWSADIGTVYQNVNESRLFFLEQLRVLFGDDLIKTLHRITREEKESGGDNEARKFYFLQKIVQISGYDLRNLYSKWGLVLDSYYQQKLDSMINNGNYLTPPCNDNLYLVTPFSKPCPDLTLPLPLKGINTSSPQPDLMPANQLASKNQYCDYSTKTGIFTDPRDGKSYAYKKYGNSEWFMQNLNWDGYDGVNENTRNTIGIANPNDPTGVIYGRYYPTNKATQAQTWCPAGWNAASEANWTSLFNAITSEYQVSSALLGSVMKCGEDRDNKPDGLWAMGRGKIDNLKANQVGFNALPAGVINSGTMEYDANDNPGTKASFHMPEGTWYHQVLTNGSDSWAKTNRNSVHNASIRCVRPAQ
ncbi:MULTISPECIES: M60 family metallopeptidase [Elizabethkingia]|uniref:Histone acetyltransferase n=1 Tax=Elizabethkingia anophelis R26 TaxID=1246994 RepID=A0ABM6MQU2_9FLAO|nr:MULTISPECIES: M60 family metallopeptidase [Elizabethkingia]AQW91901.1 histone acetyltransferase [Elizabethkingia anophelis]ATC35426.1 histone acetyltransferase [Elizabethkingia anophelis R26]ATC39064.1 histone acetyltransferase [Elizabethkingia anophelis Ag1]ATC42745.1 histone acetyltransferase [Elizabethkingia anophelis]ATC46421.1 histone acetyltransferase [Elizabethkingia anophelis]